MKELIQSLIICIAMFSFSPHFEGYNVTMATAGHRAMVNATNSRAG